MRVVALSERNDLFYKIFKSTNANRLAKVKYTNYLDDI